ncbi:Fiber protein Fb34 [Melia azedarach]|uniref:Fiber protein Fb34 n=1 Tax=Melia azedarach TaxID=155640 RepID=A0ACC1XGF3_MELAZ|nr:Fiber protein Fb34 [Melia azedarach]
MGVLGEGKGSTLVHLLVVVLSLVAFGFAIAAERRRSIGHLTPVPDQANATYCVYTSDVATGYGAGAFLFLLSSESLLMGVTKCMCFGRPLAPGGNRAWTIIYFITSWATFLVAESCLIAGAKKNAYHTKYRSMIYAQNFSCETLRKGVFITGAVFVVATMILNVYYYMYFTKCTSSQAAARKANRAGSTVGMTGAGYA